LPPTGSLLRDPLERTLEQHGVPLTNNYVETLSTHLARAYLHITDAIGVMAGAVANDAAQPLAVLPLTLPNLMRPRGVLWNKDRGLTPGGKLMISCLEEAAAQLQAEGAA
jgi:DNA-binding transcriptional LysR family regulator